MSKFGESATPRIDPRQLQDFLAVVEHGSITAAAANQFTGTSSVSQSIARLERRVGGRLFNRSRTGATLTARGRNLIDPAREALAALDRLVVEREFLLSAVPHLSVATTASLADDPAAVLLGALRTEVPNLRITISDPPGSSVADAIHPVMAGTADVAIMESLPTGVPGTRTVRLPDHKLRLVCPPGTPPPVDGVFIGEDLMRIGLVVAPRFETSDVYRQLRSIEPRIDHAFVMRSQHRDAFADFAYEGIGAVILELSSAERASERGCTVGEIFELPPRKIAAVARDGPNTQIVEHFLRLCAEQSARKP
ncbi:LysR family transcriptional regulator [Rhodococcus qingshengii]|uniref:LysR family transcriptional regulator n=1 Tax=Rhodococcus qingshengii TaxID=334542 RepID=UPI0018779DC3|nr:LysR family transcriptional regulator [Rhodococcus qingshengii]QOS60911.1 LysR family transcriptional regulator [Rhodococcus qingshengii]